MLPHSSLSTRSPRLETENLAFFSDSAYMMTVSVKLAVEPEVRLFPSTSNTCVSYRIRVSFFDFVGLRSSINLTIRHKVVLIICDHGFQTFPLLAETSSVIYELHN